MNQAGDLDPHLEEARSEPQPRRPDTVPVARVADALGVNAAVGLSEEEANRRNKRFGPNLLVARKRVPDSALILRQFASSVVALLVAALVLSLTFGEWQQGAAIATVLVINAAIGYYTEGRPSRPTLRAACTSRSHSSPSGVRPRSFRHRSGGRPARRRKCATLRLA
jgi:Ca2+-transporting ATPase